MHRAVEGVGRIDDRGSRGAVGQVAAEQVIGGREARAVLERAADVEPLTDDLQAGHVPAERGPARIAERLPARAVPDREEVGVRVAPRVREGATGIDLAGGHGDGGDAPVRDLRGRRADGVPVAAVPGCDAIRVGNAARIGELAAHVERALRRRQRRSDEVQRVGSGYAPVPEVIPAAGTGGRRRRHDRADDQGRECENANKAALAGRADASHPDASFRLGRRWRRRRAAQSSARNQITLRLSSAIVHRTPAQRPRRRRANAGARQRSATIGL